MRAVLQRVLKASVTIDGKMTASIETGILALIGLAPEDDEAVMEYMLDKIRNLRIFEDEYGKMNLSLQDIKGELLLVPNFTLYGDTRKGRRPGYSSGASPEKASGLFLRLIEKAKELPFGVETGVFQADMKVELLNDGPVTLLIDSDKNF